MMYPPGIDTVVKLEFDDKKKNILKINLIIVVNPTTYL